MMKWFKTDSGVKYTWNSNATSRGIRHGVTYIISVIYVY